MEQELNFEINESTEYNRLCHLLHSAENDFSFLKKMNAKELFLLRTKISDAIQDEHASTWEKLAAVAKFMPNFVNAKISQEILGPSISANLTYFVPLRDAISISSHFSDSFLADVTEHLIPSKSQLLLAEFPIEKIKKVIAQLEKRKGYYTMGNFVDYMPLERVTLFSKEIKSEETLLRTGTFANKKDRLAPVIKEFTDEKLKSLIITGSKLNLTEEILSIIKHVPDSDLTRYLGILFSIGGEIFSHYLNTLKKIGGEELERIKNLTEKMGIKIDWSN